MALRNGSLGLGYAYQPPMVQEQPSPLHQTEQRGELPNYMDITIGQSKKPQFLKSIDDLATLSAAVDAFKRQFDDLQKHIEFIDNEIESNLKSNGVDLTVSPSFNSPVSPLRNKASADTTATVGQLVKEPEENAPEMSNKTEPQRLCRLSCCKGLRKYINANISDRAKLMAEIPAALKLAKEPAKFVLECIGKFYIQGRKAFTKNSPMILARQVSLIILEAFLLMPDLGEDKIKSCIKDEAEMAANAWRKRLMGEGRLADADQMDARGLLLLIAGFGVPSKFRSLDLLDLVKQSGSNEIAGALRRSRFRVPVISGIVESIMKRGMHIEALEVVFTFGMEDRFSASLVLSSFLRMSKNSFERAKQKAQSPMAFKEANEKHLAALLSVMQFLEAHKLNPGKEVPEWQINERIIELEKDTLQLNKEIEEKARSISLMEEAMLTKRLYNQQMKRPRLSPMEMPPVASSSYSPIYRDRSFPSHRDEDRDDISALVSSYLGPAALFPHRSHVRRSPEYVVMPGGSGRIVSTYEHMPPNSYSPVHGERLPRQCSPSDRQRLPRQYSTSIHGHQQIPSGLQMVYGHSPSVERYLSLPHHRSPHRSPRNSPLDHIGGM